MQNNFRELEDRLVFFDLWIPDSGFRIPDSGFRFADFVFRFPGVRVARSFELVELNVAISVLYAEIFKSSVKKPKSPSIMIKIPRYEV